METETAKLLAKLTFLCEFQTCWLAHPLLSSGKEDLGKFPVGGSLGWLTLRNVHLPHAPGRVGSTDPLSQFSHTTSFGAFLIFPYLKNGRAVLEIDLTLDLEHAEDAISFQMVHT